MNTTRQSTWAYNLVLMPILLVGAMDRVVLLPHVGSASNHTRNQMGKLVADNLVAFAEGKPPLTTVAETPFKGW